MYHSQAAFWTNAQGKKCCDVGNRRQLKASQSRRYIRLHWLFNQQQSRIRRSDPAMK